MIELKQGRAQYVPVKLTNVSGDPQVGLPYTDVTASVLKEDMSVVNMGLLDTSFWVQATGGAFTSQGFYQLLLTSSLLNVTGSFTYAVSGGPSTVTYFGSVDVVSQQAQDVLDGLANISGSSGSSDAALILQVSQSLWTEIESIRLDLSASLINVSSSLHNKIESSRVDLSGALHAKIESAREDLSGTMINVSASLYEKISYVYSQLSATVMSVSQSLYSKIESTRVELGGILTVNSSSLEKIRKTEQGRWKINSVTNQMTFYDNDGSTPFMIFGLSGSDGTPTTTNPYERNRVG